MIRRIEESRRPVPTPDPVGGGTSTVAVYQATADSSAGEVTVKAVEADGTQVGDTITLKVLP